MKVWLVTFPTYNSRVSERACYYGKKGVSNQNEPIILDRAQCGVVLNLIGEAACKHQITILKLKVLPDHVHLLLLAQDKKDLSEKIRKLKGGSSYKYNRTQNIPKGSRLWTRRYDYRLITSNDYYLKACAYIDSNDSKHLDKWD